MLKRRKMIFLALVSLTGITLFHAVRHSDAASLLPLLVLWAAGTIFHAVLRV